MKPYEFARRCSRLGVLRPQQDIRGAGVLTASDDCLIHIDGCTFKHNVGASSGVLEFLENVKAVIINSRFVRNSGMEAGVLRAYNSSAVINASTFLHSEDQTVALIAMVALGSSLTMSGDILDKSPRRTTSMVKIINNSSMLLHNMTVTHSKSTIGNNALFQCEEFSNCTFFNASFAFNKAAIISGVQECIVNISGCSLLGNHEMLLDVRYGSSLFFENTMIANHSSESDGKMILIQNNSTANISNSVIGFCEGNAFLEVSFQSSASLTNISMQFNEVDSCLVNIVHHSTAYILNSTIEGNIVVLSAEKKVASLIIAQLNSRISAVNSVIGRNAVWSRTGKTINVKNGSIFLAERCTFHNNIASIGGASSCEGNSSIVWTNSIFSYNKGNDYGQWRIYIVKFWTRAPPWGSKFFQFHAVFGNIWPNRVLAPPLGSWRPLLGEILDPPLMVAPSTVKIVSLPLRIVP